MGMPSDQSAFIRAPMSSNKQTLTASGTNESSTATILPVGVMHTIKVGGVAVNVAFTSAVGLAAQVSSTNLPMQAGQSYDWTVEPGSAAVYCESTDGASTHLCVVWASSP